MILPLLTCVQVETLTNNLQRNFLLTQNRRNELIAEVRAAASPKCWPLVRAQDPVTFVGDSITAWGNWQEAFPERTVFNAGVPGDTTFHIAWRLPSIQATTAKTYILMVGINDIWGWKFDPSSTAARIEYLRNVLKADDSRVVVQSTISCLRSACGSTAVNNVGELNRLLRNRIPKEDYLDINVVLSDRNGLKSQYTYDGIHLTPAGYSVWQQKLRESGLL